MILPSDIHLFMKWYLRRLFLLFWQLTMSTNQANRWQVFLTMITLSVSITLSKESVLTGCWLNGDRNIFLKNDIKFWSCFYNIYIPKVQWRMNICLEFGNIPGLNAFLKNWCYKNSIFIYVLYSRIYFQKKLATCY